MLKLKPLNQSDKEQHFKLLEDRFYESLAFGLCVLGPRALYHQDLMEFLGDVLKDILVGSPADLEAIALAVQTLHPEFSAYVTSAKKTPNANNVIHKNTLELIEQCFDYGKFSLKSTDWSAYALVRAHDLRICPYCHAHHVNYHIDPAATSLAQQYRIRPPLDHFLPKSSYPYFAVSLHNLVPSCAQCNSSVKSTADPLTLGLVSPHDGDIKIGIHFSAVGSVPASIKGTADDIQISLQTSNTQSTALVQTFLLQERYQWYRNEVKDLIDRHVYHRTIPAALRAVVSRERFVLGHTIAEVQERMIGLCLRDIYLELESQQLG